MDKKVRRHEWTIHCSIVTFRYLSHVAWFVSKKWYYVFEEYESEQLLNARQCTVLINGF